MTKNTELGSGILRKPRFLQFTTKDQILFTRRLSVYLSSGVPLLEGLALLNDDAQTRSTSYIFTILTRTVSEGRTLSSGLTLFPRLVTVFTVSMIEVGEQSGTLRESLSYLAIALKKQQALKGKLIGALIYPAIIVVTTCGICIFLILYAFPKIIPIFRGFGSALPFATRALIAVSDLLSKYGLIFILLLLLIGVIAFFLLRIPTLRSQYDFLVLRIPILGSLIQTYYLSSISRTLSTLLRTGIGIVPALELASATSRSKAYAESLISVRDRVLAGERIADSLSPYSVPFPRMYIQMVGTGERTGSLPNAFHQLSDHYEEEFDTASSTLATLIEPVLMIVMGLLVGFIALAIITPVYQITQDMHG